DTAAPTWAWLWTACWVFDPAEPYLATLAVRAHPPPLVANAPVEAIAVPPVTVEPTTAVVAPKMILTVLVSALAANCPQAWIVATRPALSKGLAGMVKTAITLSAPVAPGDTPAPAVPRVW